MKIIILLLSCFTICLSNLSATMLNGHIRDKETKELIPFVNVMIKGTQQGTISDEHGYYEITNIKKGKYTIIYSLIGYKPLYKEIDLTVDRGYTPYLEREVIMLQGITVWDLMKKYKMQIPIAKEIISIEHEIEKPVPADTSYLYPIIPQIKSVPDFDYGLYTFENSPEHKLFLLDDISIFNPTHIVQGFGTFNAQSVDNITKTLAGYNSSFRERLSYMVSACTRSGKEKFSGITKTSAFDNGITIDLPFKYGSSLVSGRVVYPEPLLKSIESDNFPSYYFYDANSKLDILLGNKDNITISAYISKDDFDSDNSFKLNHKQDNRMISSLWEHYFNENLYSKLRLGSINYNSSIDLTYNNSNLLEDDNKVNSLSIEGSLKYNFKNKHKIDFGFRHKNTDFSLDGEQSDYNLNTGLSTFFAEDNWQLNSLLSLNYGLDISYYNKGKRWTISPLVTVKYLTDVDVKVYATYGIYHQYISYVHSYKVNYPLSYVWLPADNSIKPSNATHYVLGVNWDKKGKFHLNIETFYKKLDKIYQTKDSLLTITNEKLTEVLTKGDGYATGLNLTFRNQIKKFSGFMQYSFTYNKRKFDGINNGNYFFPQTDRTHQLTLRESYYLGNWKGDWNIGVQYMYATGQPDHFSSNKHDVWLTDIIFHKKDISRIKDYSRVDVSLNHKVNYRHFSIEYYFYVFNLLDYENVYSKVSYDSICEDIKLFPIMPNIGIKLSW